MPASKVLVDKVVDALAPYAFKSTEASAAGVAAAALAPAEQVRACPGRGEVRDTHAGGCSPVAEASFACGGSCGWPLRRLGAST